MRARWTSDPCYAFFGVDGTECSFLVYLSEVEWFCPPLPWRNQTAPQMAPKPLPKVQVGLGGGWVCEGVEDGSSSLPRLDSPLRPASSAWWVGRSQLALLDGERASQCHPTFWGCCRAGPTGGVTGALEAPP